MKYLFLAAILLTTGFLGYGQCDKKVRLTSSKTEHLGADSSVQRTEPETTIVEFDKSDISISPGEQRMTGKINSATCNWTTPFKVGKTRLKITLTTDDGQTQNATITIEGKDGKISFLAELDNTPDRKIRLAVDKFEEKQ